VRTNLDTLYSTALFDLDAGPVTITLPDAGKRYRAMLMVTEDHYMPMIFHDAGSYAFTRKQFDTRYLLAEFRTFVDPNDPKDIEQVHALQDAIKIDQPGGPGHLQLPNWDQASLKKVREALLVLLDAAGPEKGERPAGAGRSGTTSYRDGVSLGTQSR
jgi:hypothetical protein